MLSSALGYIFIFSEILPEMLKLDHCAEFGSNEGHHPYAACSGEVQGGFLMEEKDGNIPNIEHHTLHFKYTLRYIWTDRKFGLRIDNGN